MATGPRVDLTSFQLTDLEAVHTYTSNPEVCRYSLWGPNSLAETEAFLTDAMDARVGRVMAAVLFSGKVIGSTSIWVTDEIHGVGELGYTLNPEYWGQGLATEVAQLLITVGKERLGLNTVEATCDPRNTASIRVLEKSGFVFAERRALAGEPIRGRDESLVYVLNPLGTNENQDASFDHQNMETL
ncbi:GNAT family N-acetyltransferase [Glutamicibacter ectropisis]|uniref:GNAT family N-acetyltransferase n=1 Tax=Glutamicibacter ectropisis TaxID=3046593 RepID=A0AAU6WJ46_9MICC